jgi:DNA primase
MARIARQSIDQVQAAADMVEVVGQYTELRKAGANYSGRCPFHEERTPSFSVNPTEKLYYCFGCGAGGNLFGFVQEKENLDFPGAVEYLAEKYGVALEYEESSARGDAERRRRERLRTLLEQATAYYERVLAEAKAAAPAREYLARRGFEADVCHRFRLGFSLAAWDKLLQAAAAKGFTEQDLLDAGLVIPGKQGRPYDRFRGRLIFPLADDRGRTLGFGARTLGDDKPKYLNSPETALYHKSEALFGIHAAKGFTEQDLLDAGLVIPGKQGRPYDRFRGRLIFPLADDRGRTLGFGARTLGDDKPKYLNSPETALYHKSEALFGIHAAKKAAAAEDRVYVVEGYTDVLALAQAGVENVVASMGTALTEQQLARLSRLTKNLYLCFDADAAGLGAMSRALRLGRTMGLSLHVVRIPDGLDPADYVLAGAGAEGFRALAGDAQTLLQFHVRLALATHDLDKPDGRASAFAQLKGVLREAASPIERDEELRYIADRLQLSAESARYLVAGSGRPSVGGSDAPQAGGHVAAVGGAHELEVRFLAGCLARPEKGRAVLAGVDEGFFASAETRAALRSVKLRLEALAAGNTLQTAENDGASDDAGEALAEVVVRAGRERFTDAVVDELFLRVQEAQIGRLMAKLKVAAGADESDTQSRELARLQTARRKLRDALRTIPVDERPDQG